MFNFFNFNSITMKSFKIRMKTMAAIAACFAVCMAFTGCDPKDALSGDKQMVAFGFVLPPAVGVIDEAAKTVAVELPAGTVVTALAPVIVVSPDATVSPASGVPNDFSQPATYTVTAADGSKAVYTVTVTVENVQPVELTSPITVNTTLIDKGLPIDYYYNGDNLLQVKNNAILTIEDGVTIQFRKTGGGIEITDGATLKALGTANKHIQFVGATAEKGAWRGIQINTETANELSYADILNAGGENYDRSASLYIYTGNVSVNHCLIDRSKTNGVTVEGNWGKGVLTAFGNNTVSNCDKAPIYTSDYACSWNVRNIDNTNTFTGNANAYIHIRYSGNAPVYSDMTLRHLNGYPWYFEDGLEISDDKTITIEAGAVIIVGAEERIYVPSSSHLIAVGTAQSRITIKGKNATPGYWKGILVYSQTPGTKLDYCNISDAGNGAFGTTENNGLVYYSANSYLELYNCNLSNSLHSGVVCAYSSSSFNVHYNAYFKQSNNTLSTITGAIFRINEPDEANYGALPTTGSSWWQYY
jgi:hypothetical protein